MTALLDTNMIVRYLTDEPLHLAEQAARIVDSRVELTVTDVAIAEAAYVLFRITD